MKRFHIVTHSYTASFSVKTHLMKLTTSFISRIKQIYAKKVNCYWKCIQNKGDVRLDTFRTFAYVSSCLQTKIFARKRDYAVSSKLQIPRH